VAYFLPNHDNFQSIVSKHESLDDGDVDHDDEDRDGVDHDGVGHDEEDHDVVVGQAYHGYVDHRVGHVGKVASLSITGRTAPSCSTDLVVVHKELVQ